MSERSANSSGFCWDQAAERAVWSAPGLIVAFARDGDRWTHSLDRAKMPIARAVEGRPERDGPARVISPVYQEAQLQGPGGVAASSNTAAFLLLTGQSFAHHFSAVVGEAADDEKTRALDFDVADRCRAPIEGFAATYDLDMDCVDLIDAAPDRAVWALDDGVGQPARLELRALGGCSIALGQAGHRAARVQVVAPIDPGAFTHRLRYRWRWSLTSSG